MRMHALLVVVALTLPTIAAAQTPTQRRTPPRTQQRRLPPPPAQPKIGIRGYATFGNTTLAAKQTFDAVADTHSRATYLGGAQVTNIWKGVFADVAATQLSIDGHRVFVSGGTIFNLGIPLEVKMRPIDVAGGWRFRYGRLSPYVGAGFTHFTYKETSDFAASGEDVDESKVGALFLGGVDVQAWKWIHVGGELRYRRVRGILGEGGASSVSTEFNDDDAGGFGAAVRISIGR